jgi:hypothetical protein
MIATGVSRTRFDTAFWDYGLSRLRAAVLCPVATAGRKVGC